MQSLSEGIASSLRSPHFFLPRINLVPAYLGYLKIHPVLCCSQLKVVCDTNLKILAIPGIVKIGILAVPLYFSRS